MFTRENFCQEHLLVSKEIMSLYLFVFCKLLMMTIWSCRTGAYLCLVIPVSSKLLWRISSKLNLGKNSYFTSSSKYIFQEYSSKKLLPDRRNLHFSFDLKQQRGKLRPISFLNCKYPKNILLFLYQTSTREIENWDQYPSQTANILKIISTFCIRLEK